jgi:hypothetical protein
MITNRQPVASPLWRAAMDEIVFSDYTVQDLLVVGGGIAVLLALVALLRKIF